jgi:LytS/YehU family sensor histidine kinase
VRIRVGEDAADEAGELRAALRSGEATVGSVRVDAARGRRRLLSEDRALLESLAEGLSFLLDNVRLEATRRAQEATQRELALQASRAELRALRAQINPHFLFNALNTIAALIPRDPPRAEECVERLAEVFRYTLRGSENEWVRVEEEMTFVGAYLDLERTRFRERLEVVTDVDERAAPGFIPAMAVQTLVENAVKHGIGPVRGQGRVEVEVRRCGDRLRIEVRDTGPGFSLEDALTSPGSPRAGGRGLRNVRDRLRGYFGERARMTSDREPAQGTTRVALDLPFLTEVPEVAKR